MNDIDMQIRKLQTDKRYLHTKAVVAMAEKLANTYQLDVDKCKLAALVHDATKQLDCDTQLSLIKDKVDQHVIDTPPLWHSFSGSYYIQAEFGITDQDIIDSVRYHTTGIKTTNKYVMCIYLSDYLEETRPYPEIDQYRLLIGKLSLEQLYSTVAKARIEYELSAGHKLHHLTEELYESIV